MPNIIKLEKIIDTQKRALLKYVILTDGTTNEANTVLLDAGSLNYALNVNNKILGAGTDRKSAYRTSIKRIFGSVKAGGNIRLQWRNDSNSEIVALAGGQVDLSFEPMGDGATISTTGANATGNILITTVGTTTNDAYTLFIDLRKDNRDYDAGQTADPVAFNQGPALFT